MSMNVWYAYRAVCTAAVCYIALLLSVSLLSAEYNSPIPRELLDEIEHQVKTKKLWHAIDMADVAAVRELIAQGCGADVINFPHFWNTIIFAASSRSEAIIRLLLHNGGDPNSTDGDGWSALMYAASRGTTGVLCALLEAGADVNMADGQGNTALHAVAFTGRRDIIPYLILAGAELDAEHESQGTPLEYACCCGRYEHIPEFILYGARIPKADIMQNMTDRGKKMIHYYRKRYRAEILQQLCPMIVSPHSLSPDIPAVLCGLILEFVNGDQCRTVSPCSGIVSQ